MQREQLEHVLRASAAIALEKSFVVIGSQAVLLPFPNAAAELLLSNEVDLYPALHPERAELIEGSIGVLSPFNDTYGYHADGVGPETATMPLTGCNSRSSIGDVTVVSPDLHDIAVSKCVAARDKDADYVRTLLRHRMIDPSTLEARLRALDASKWPIDKFVAWAGRRANEAFAP